MDNWIEREARQKERMKIGAPELWQDVMTAVEDTCNSYTKHHAEVGKARFQPQNGHSVLIEVAHESMPSTIADMKRRIRLTFDGIKSISITLDEHSLAPVVINADEDRCFLTINKKEISIDEFCKYALSDGFFTPRIPQRPGSPKPKSPWLYELQKSLMLPCHGSFSVYLVLKG